jgi:hypothetical protein
MDVLRCHYRRNIPSEEPFLSSRDRILRAKLLFIGKTYISYRPLPTQATGMLKKINRAIY